MTDADADADDQMWTDYAQSGGRMEGPGRHRMSNDQTQTDYLRRIHFWVRFWSVLMIVGGVLGGLAFAFAVSQASGR